MLAMQVDTEVRQARRDELISQQQGISQRFAESLVGREVGLVTMESAPVSQHGHRRRC